ncbi:hypothetical protein KZP23_07505 [Echinicola marina]|uniref:hypothetical protein n=1 Tax=Echinicola marina TaxID=2859768 RepID=UPI001CF6DFD0|nr:hypothetical protein [Echinicola marina]UCS94846.1 hypothetical protein KZP23_07505 [Echinicola marina]
MTQEERVSALTEKLEGAPESYKEARINNLGRMTFKDDDDFNGFLDDIDTDIKELQQMQADSKMKGFGGIPRRSKKDISSEADKEKVSDIVSSMMGLPPKKKTSPESKSEKDSTTKNIVKNIMRWDK